MAAERKIVRSSRMVQPVRRWGLGLAWSYNLPALLVYTGTSMHVFGKHFTRDGVPFITSSLEFCVPVKW